MASLRATATLRGCRRHESMESHYTAIEQAVSILFARRQKSCSRPRDALEGYLASGRFAVLFRPVATPNFELLRFASLATAHNLTPLVLEYHRDKFVSYCNPIKHALARMRFHNGTGRNGGARITALTVTNISASTGRILADVTTFSGEPLVAFHHHLLSTVGDLREVIFYDASIWLGAHAPTARRIPRVIRNVVVQHLGGRAPHDGDAAATDTATEANCLTVARDGVALDERGAEAARNAAAAVRRAVVRNNVSGDRG